MSDDPHGDRNVAPSALSRTPYLRRPANYNILVLLFVLCVSSLISIGRILDRSIEAGEETVITMGAACILLPSAAILIALLILPRRESRVERFRPSPWEVDEDAEVERAKLQADGRRDTMASAPRSFSARLAGYLHVPESEVLAPKPPAVSSMPFWCLVPLPGMTTLAKSAAYIRAVLRRIRAAVRGVDGDSSH